MLKRTLAISLALVIALSGVSGNAVPTSKAYQPAAGSTSRCDPEKNLKGFEAKLQKFLKNQGRCSGAVRVADSKLPSTKPKSILSGPESLFPIEKCKLPQPVDGKKFNGFPFGDSNYYISKKHPGPGSIIQVVGISSPDAPASKATPSQEYKFYFDALRDWFGNVNNSGEPVVIRVKDKWFDYGSNLAPLKINHKADSTDRDVFTKRVVELVDSEIDFTGVDYLITVVPSATSYQVISQSGMSGKNTSEGLIRNMSLMMQPNLKVGETHPYLNFLNITATIHELYHPGFHMGDQYGDEKKQFENRGMGQWGMFATSSSDMLQWQKWLLGFTTDTQVVCAAKDQTSTSWISPGSTKSSKQKLLVVPLSSSEAIVVESVRATGLNYKLSRVEQGALVYVLDLNNQEHGMGYEVQFPQQRKWKSVRYSMDTAPFKKGESFTYKGVKITNVEWGEFGDVIKVEPVK
jgi:M6 family metalloprotease-like protein